MAKTFGFLDRVLSAYRSGAAAFEFRSSLENPQTPLSFPAEWLLDIFNGGRTDSGIRVSEMTALQVGTVYACVNIISNGVAGLPYHVFERTIQKQRASKQIAYDHPLYNLLAHEPNPEMTKFTFFKTFLCHCTLWGNGYAEIERDPKTNKIVAIWPRNPARTRPIRNVQPIMLEGDLLPAGTLMYETSEPLRQADHPSPEEHDLNLGRRRIILAEDMLHVPGLSLDGRLGQSTCYLARQIIGLALATEKYGAKFFGNGARPAGILTLPNKIEDKAVENLRRSWAEAHGGENQFKVAVLEQGVKFEKIAATPEEGQMLQTRSYERAEVCSVFNVPLHMVGASEKAGKSNIEQSSIEFVMYCLHPWLEAIELEFRRKLFTNKSGHPAAIFPKFDVRKLMYPDADARSKFYSSGRQWGYLNADDIRELEDMNPIGGKAGSTYWMPTNMQDAEDPTVLGAQATVDFHDKNPEYAPQPPAAPTPAGAASKAAGKPVGKDKVMPAAAGSKASPKSKKQQRSLVGDPLMYVMRHGTTDANLKDIYRGWGPYQLDDEGIQAAQQAAEYLKGRGITMIVTSTLPRHKQTAEIVSKALGNAPIIYDEDLRTLNVGVYTGKKKSEAEDDVQYYLENPDEEIPGGESVSDFQERSNKAFKRAHKTNKVAGPVVVITSRSNIAGLASEGVTGGDIRVAEPGGVYRMDASNNLTLVYGDEISDTLAGT